MPVVTYLFLLGKSFFFRHLKLTKNGTTWQRTNERKRLSFLQVFYCRPESLKRPQGGVITHVKNLWFKQYNSVWSFTLFTKTVRPITVLGQNAARLPLSDVRYNIYKHYVWYRFSREHLIVNAQSTISVFILISNVVRQPNLINNISYI